MGATVTSYSWVPVTNYLLYSCSIALKLDLINTPIKASLAWDVFRFQFSIQYYSMVWFSILNNFGTKFDLNNSILHMQLISRS